MSSSSSSIHDGGLLFYFLIILSGFVCLFISLAESDVCLCVLCQRCTCVLVAYSFSGWIGLILHMISIDEDRVTMYMTQNMWASYNWASVDVNRWEWSYVLWPATIIQSDGLYWIIMKPITIYSVNYVCLSIEKNQSVANGYGTHTHTSTYSVSESMYAFLSIRMDFHLLFSGDRLWGIEPNYYIQSKTESHLSDFDTFVWSETHLMFAIYIRHERKAHVQCASCGKSICIVQYRYICQFNANIGHIKSNQTLCYPNEQNKRTKLWYDKGCMSV